MHIPANIITIATGNSQAAVTYTATADDLINGSASVDCDHASGASFAVGTTT
jgi:hypothetical protein